MTDTSKEAIDALINSLRRSAGEGNNLSTSIELDAADLIEALAKENERLQADLLACDIVIAKLSSGKELQSLMKLNNNLVEERDEANDKLVILHDYEARYIAAIGLIEEQHEKIEKLREVLKPFGDVASVLSAEWQDHESHWYVAVSSAITTGHLRAARRALEVTQ